MSDHDGYVKSYDFLGMTFAVKASIGEVEKLTVLGVPAYMRVGSMKWLAGFCWDSDRG